MKSDVNLGNFWFYQNAGRSTDNLVGIQVFEARMAPSLGLQLARAWRSNFNQSHTTLSRLDYTEH